MNCVSVRCCVVLEMCYFEHMINVKVWNVILWLNLWDKWCYAMSGKMMQIVLSWVCYTYVCVCVCDFGYLYLFENVITHSLCVVCVWIPWWSRTLCSWENMTRWIALKNPVLGMPGHDALIGCDIEACVSTLIAWCSKHVILLYFILLLNLSSFVNLSSLVLS